MKRSRKFAAGVPLALLLLAAEGRAEESLALPARSLSLAGAFAGARDDPAAVSWNPAAMNGTAIHLGGSLAYASLDARGEGIAGFPRAALTVRVGNFALGGGFASRGYEGRGFRDATEYEASFGARWTLFEEASGGRLALGLAYRPRVVRLHLEDFDGFAFGPLGVAGGVVYSPFDELSFGLVLESGGTAEGTVVDGTTLPSNPRRATVSAFTAPSATWGVELEADRWTARLDYRVVLASLRSRLDVGEAAFERPPVEPPADSWGDFSYGAARDVSHAVALGLEHRFPVGRGEIPFRAGLGLVSANEGATADEWTTRLAPRGVASVGLGLRLREHEVSFGTRVSTNLGEATSLLRCACTQPESLAAFAWSGALDWTYRFDR